MQVLLGLGSGNLVYLEVGPGSIQQAGHLQLQAELACLDITPLGEDPERAQIAVAGEACQALWWRQCFAAGSCPLLPCFPRGESKGWALACSAVQEWHACSEQPHCASPYVHVMLLALDVACAGARTALSCNVVQPSDVFMSVMPPLLTLPWPAGSTTLQPSDVLMSAMPSLLTLPWPAGSWSLRHPESST